MSLKSHGVTKARASRHWGNDLDSDRRTRSKEPRSKLRGIKRQDLTDRSGVDRNGLPSR